MSTTNFSRLMALLVVPLLLAAFVISAAAISDHDDQFSTAGFQSTLKHVDHLLVSNLTKTELFLRAVKRGNLKVQAAQRLNSIQTPIRENGGGEYLMQFSIGTPNPSRVTALMDTGSSLIWTPCQTCDFCFGQLTPFFDPKKSTTYSPLKCTSKGQCKSNMVNSECSSSSNGGSCTYNNSYVDGSITRGVLATDTFTFDGPGRVPKIVFGCAALNIVSFGITVGVVGLGPQGLSLVSQMNESKLSYCFPTFGSRNTGVLAMGTKSPTPGSQVKSTPLIKNLKKPDFYYLSLQGITIGTKRLSVNSTTFEIKKDGSGGMIIASGAAITYLVRTAFDQVDKELTTQLGLRKSFWGSFFGLQLCYAIGSDSDDVKFPVMVFHFKNGVDLRLTQENYMFIQGGIGCLAIAPVGNNNFSVLGNFQQQNTLVFYDLAKRTLSFQPNYENCSGD